MLSLNLKRALLESRLPVPPTFLLPWAASLTTVSHTTGAGNVPPPLLNTVQQVSAEEQAAGSVTRKAQTPKPKRVDPTTTLARSATVAGTERPTTPSTLFSSPVAPLSESVRDLLPLLQAQGSHYITAHIHDRPYLITQGDTVRLPFFMKDAEPGDVLRLNKATNIGSRDYTLKASAPAPKLKSATTTTRMVLDPTTGSLESHSRVMPATSLDSNTAGASAAMAVAPHFIPHIAKGKVSYLDERLFVCRAVVMGMESEPMRMKEKTKRRNRKIKTVRSKHRYTVLKIKEVRIRGVEEIEGGGELA
ncbi:hypothetical protein LTR08_001581 [Meristemomyces frigidus]|nr:hypothetical protein LTR08_001581 [Meristemomyces frigidus]